MGIKQKLAISSLVAAAVGFASPGRAVSLVANGNFATGDLTGWTDSMAATAATNFDTSPCNGDLGCIALVQQEYNASVWSVGTGNNLASPYNGSTYAAQAPMGGSSATNLGNVLYQTVSTTPGATYAVSFAAFSVGGSPGVQWNNAGSFQGDVFNGAANGMWTVYSLNLVATSTSMILGFDNFGALGLLDNVSVNEVSATPLPAALPLFAGGLGALGLLNWRRKRKAAALAA
jgi:hypothetical protein